MALNYIKSFAQAGFAKQGVVDYGTGETGENYLDTIGDDALGIITALDYGTYLDNPTNHAFIAGLEKERSEGKARIRADIRL